MSLRQEPLAATVNGPAPEPRPRRANWLLFGLGVVTVLTLSGYLGALSWTLELASHFRLQYAIAALLLVPLAAWWRGRRWALAAAGVAVVNAGAVAPLYVVPEEEPASDRTPLRVVAFNVNAANTDAEAILAFLAESRPMIVVLFEVAEPLAAALESQADGPLRVVLSKPRDDNFGVTLLSALPVEANFFYSQGLPFVEARFEHEGARWSLLGVHPVPPIGPLLAEQRDDSLAEIANWARAQSGPHMVVGDLNCTPFSPSFWVLLDTSGLDNSQIGFGYQASWPSRPWPLWPLQIPIDHALVGGGLRTLHREVGPALGSDHLPIIVDLVASES